MSLKNALFLAMFPPYRGGAQYTASELVNYTVSRGVNVEVIAEPRGNWEEFDGPYRRRTGVRIHRLPREATLTGSPPPREEIEELTRYISDLLRGIQETGKAPDVAVVSHEKYAWYNDVFRELDLPIIQHLMGTPTNGITQGIYPPAETKAFLESVAKADHIVCIAQHFKELIPAIIPDYPEDRVSVIHNEVDTSLFSPGPPDPALRKQLDLPAEARVIVHTSTFTPVKRVEDIVISAKAVLNEHTDVYYLLVGGNTENDEITSLVNASGHADRFRLPGSVSHDRVAQYLRQGTIFILSSKAEGLPRAAMEGQACGLYLIASDCAAGTELTLDGALGTNYPVADVDALSKTTLQALDMGPDEFDRIRKASRDNVVKKYAKGTQLPSYIALLNQIAL